MKLDSRMSHFGKRNERAIRPALAGRPGQLVKWFLFSKLCLSSGSAHVFTKIPNFTNVSQLNKNTNFFFSVSSQKKNQPIFSVKKLQTTIKFEINCLARTLSIHNFVVKFRFTPPRTARISGLKS